MATYKIKGPDGRIYRVEGPKEPVAPVEAPTPTDTTPDDMVGYGGPEAEAAQATMLANVPFARYFSDTVEQAPAKLDAIDAARREKLGAGEPLMKPSTSAALSTQGILGYGASVPVAAAIPKGVLPLVGAGAAEGALFGAGTAPEGQRVAGGTLGAIGGAAGSAAGPILENVVKGTGRMFRAGKEAFADAVPKATGAQRARGVLNEDQVIQDEAETLVSQMLKGGGRRLKDASARAEQLGPDATVIDAAGGEVPRAAGMLAEQSGDVRRQVRASGILDRVDVKGKNLREQVDALTPDALPTAQTEVNKLLKAKGAEIDEVLKSDAGKTVLPNQDQLSEFLSREENRSLLKKARRALEARTGRRGRAVGAKEAAEKIDEIDVELADYISKELSKKIARTSKGGADPVAFAQATDVKAQWDDLVDSALPDELKKLKGEYGELARRDRAVTERFEKTIQELQPGYSKGELAEVAAGKKSLAEWWQRFKGKRAYSKVGAAGLVGNEVIDALMDPGISGPVRVRMAKILLASDDVPTLIESLRKSQLSQKAKDKIFAKIAKANKRTRGVQYGTGTGLLGALAGRQEQ